MMANRKFVSPFVLRNKLGLNQKDFWEPLGLSQSGGSRIENEERRLKGPAEILYRCVYLGHKLPEVRK
jgi:DNA-binding transcriptional regulator YiaG